MDLLLRIVVPAAFVIMGLHGVINAEKVNTGRLGSPRGAGGVRIIGVATICVGLFLGVIFLKPMLAR